jgi:hypothetical protein
MDTELKLDSGLVTQLDAISQAHRMDAATSALLVRQLEAIKAQTYDVKYRPLKGRSFVPVNTNFAPGVESIMYHSYDQFGFAKLVANMADDLPLVGVSVSEFAQAVKTIGVAYDWSVLDMWRAAFAGVPLSQRKATAARQAIENSIEDAIATGITGTGMTGLVNNANVPVITLPHVGSWRLETISPDEILYNLNYVCDTVVDNCKETDAPDTLLLAPTTLNYISQKRVGVESSMTILNHFLTNSRYIKSVDSWQKLAGAGVGGKDRGLVYRRAPEILEFNMPMDFFQMPPEQKGLAYIVNTLARLGGVEVHYPLTMGYFDIALT